MKVLIIIPAHNEADSIDKTLDSLLSQSYLATEIIVVNDNSTDETNAIVESYTAQNPSVNLVYKSSSDTHQPGSKIIQAFQFGYAQRTTAYDIVCKFDADLIFPSHYLAEMVQAFQENPKLGMFGGFCSIQVGEQWQREGLTNKDHIRGALKSYALACFEKMNGLVPEMGWDTIDELLCLYHGFHIQTADNLLVKHLKPTGARYKKALPKKFGISLHQMRYDFGLAFITCLKMGINKKEPLFFFISIAYYLGAKPKKIPYLVTAKQGEFIRQRRWKGVKSKLF